MENVKKLFMPFFRPFSHRSFAKHLRRKELHRNTRNRFWEQFQTDTARMALLRSLTSAHCGYRDIYRRDVRRRIWHDALHLKFHLCVIARVLHGVVGLQTHKQIR